MAGDNQRILVIGGGFFGMSIAEYFALRGASVLLCEKEADFMQRASLVNQARVHNGYHYPRSVLTALRSRASFSRFCTEFSDCIDDSFESYYLVGALLSKVSGKQFEKFCQRIGAPCEPAPHRITRLVNPRLVDAVFATREFAFDAVKLKHLMQARIAEAGVEYRLDTAVHSVAPTTAGIEAQIGGSRQTPEQRVEIDQVFNCSYSQINKVLGASSLELIPLKHEMTEMCLVEVPEPLQHMALTLMCGPFFSVVPYPSRGLHSFSHVRYTPHYQWLDAPGQRYIEAHSHFSRVEKPTAWRSIISDAKRYLPLLSECRYQESIWEVKTLLPRSEVDDSRPILFKRDYGLKGFHCIMGGKIDNVYDAVDIVEQQGLSL